MQFGMYETGSESGAEMDQPRRRHQPRVHGSGLSHPVGEIYVTGYRFGMYRWHVMDPIRFTEKLRVTIQALGWRSPLEGQKRYLPLQDDIASTALWYQTEPHVAFPTLLDLNGLEVV
jgi:hypothetical protein